MKCPYCMKGRTEVVNSRGAKAGTGVWRRRKCLACDRVFTTSEHFSYESFMVVKRNLTRQRFVYEKLFVSLLSAIKGGKGRDKGREALLTKEMTEKVLRKMLGLESKYVSTKDIIRFAYDTLHKQDPFFAERYAMYSPYRLKVSKAK